MAGGDDPESRANVNAAAARRGVMPQIAWQMQKQTAVEPRVMM